MFVFNTMFVLKHAGFHLQRQAILSIGIVKLKHSSSALFVTGEKANQTVSILTPYVDMNDHFQDIPRLERNISLRGMKLNVTQLSEQWQILQNLVSDKLSLEERRNEIAERIKELKKMGITNDMEKYRIQGKVLRNELKTLMKTLWSLEENVILKALKLPNVLNPHTPDNLEKVVSEYGEVYKGISVDHIVNGKKGSLLEYLSPMHYYFKGAAALYEMCILSFFADELKNNNFLPFSNADFSRSIVVEGVGMDYHNPQSVFTLKEVTDSLYSHNREHLVGGASLFSFCAFHAKHVIQSEFLPVRYFSIGNQYKPARNKSHEMGLFNVCQSSVVEIFLVVPDCYDAMMAEFHRTLDLLTRLYKQLGYHFRIVYLPPLELKPWESLRASIQLFSPCLQSYIEVGHLSTCDTYISKRLLMYYENVASHERKFVRILSGTALSVPIILGCVLESEPLVSTNGLKIPNPISKNVFCTL
ncbi:serine--tRNA synthetase-like protein Slimp [Anabrus simplex]|uniref:serine--tRNA synthetase-like protein Slimp n=1 Tax=Anabrus simplex TaxID=316456 RepID=UPI0035A34B28